MTNFRDDREALDRWLFDQHEAFIAQVADSMDLEAGFQDVQIRAQSLDLIDSLEADLASSATDSSEQIVVSTLSPCDCEYESQLLGRLMKLSPAERLTLRVHIRPAIVDAVECAYSAAQLSVPDRQVFEGCSPELQIVIVEDLQLDWGRYAFLVQTRLDLVDEALREITTNLVPSGTRQLVGTEAMTWAVNVQTSFHNTIAGLLAILSHWKELLPDPHTGEHPDPVRRMIDYAAGAKRLLHSLTADLEGLADGLNDFTKADLRAIDLHRVPLHGVRWSDDTRWDKKVLKTLIRPNSVYLGGGVWEIRDGTSPAQGEQRLPVLRSHN
jgi:hypothetical protein